MTTLPVPQPLPAIDADGHVVEPDATFRDHLDPRFASYAPRVVEYGDHFRYACGDRLGFRIHASPSTVGAPGQTAKVTDTPLVARGASDPAGRIDDLDVEGIYRAVLYPTYGLMIQGVVQREPAAHFPVEQMMTLTTLIAFGILERHPHLRVALLECGAGWLPYYAHRLDEHLEVFGFDHASLSMRPSDYVRRQCFVSVEDDEPGLASVLAQFPDSVVFASDYPHADGVFPGATKAILDSTSIDDDDKRRVLVQNAQRLYGLQPTTTEPRSAL